GSGFSALLYTLLDTGPDSTFSYRAIISHWHSDHTGGLLSVLNLRNQNRDANSRSTCVVDVHPDRPVARGIAPGPKYDKVGSVWVSGEIPRVTEFESQGLLGAMRWKDREWVPEPHIMDERYAAIDVAGKGLVLFSACSHAGIVNVVKHAVDSFARPIHMVIGGLHLAGIDNAPRIQPTVDFFSTTLRPSPNYILPMHCTGFQAKVALEQALGEGCVPAGVGITVEVEADRELEKRLTSAVYQRSPKLKPV
ncbi:hypothetical protein MPER_10887, partial [Moniliophthora perniciosa FA553]